MVKQFKIIKVCAKLFSLSAPAQKTSPYIEKIFLDIVLYIKANSAIVRCLLEGWIAFSMTMNIYLFSKGYTTKDIHLIKSEVSSILIYAFAYVYYTFGL